MVAKKTTKKTGKTVVAKKTGTKVVQKYTNAQIVAELRRVFVENNEQPFSRRSYEEVGLISKTTIENRFGSWTDALKEARLYNRFVKARKAA